jgi:NADPH-dependent 2,4-dienoyl-CoA reductase/sulfur reductase-like enzyme
MMHSGVLKRATGKAMKILPLLLCLIWSHLQAIMSTSNESKPCRVAVIGAGLVGTLNAVYFAQRGWHVDLFELRKGNILSFVCIT